MIKITWEIYNLQDASLKTRKELDQNKKMN